MSIAPSKPAGTIDHVVPIYNPELPWHNWSLYEIFTGDIGKDRYVPRVDDYVTDIRTGEQFIVTNLDESTLLVKMRPVKSVANIQPDENDVLIGVGPGGYSSTYRVYVDKSVVPPSFCADRRLHVYGSDTSYVQFVRGAVGTPDAVVVAGLYDQAGRLITQNIPLELVVMPNAQNLSVKTPKTAYATVDLVDGEVVTAVVYNDAGGVVGKTGLLVENTAFMRQTDTSQRYVTTINLETPFLSPTKPDTINYPLNVPLNGLNLFCVINYSDGSRQRIPVDGRRATVMGLDPFLATQVGQTLEIVLKYNLADDEIVYGATNVNGRFITKKYKLVVQNREGAYTNKLYAFPRYVDQLVGYALDWYLLNLDRNVYYPVTQYIKYNDNFPKFRGNDFGSLQRISVSLNLKDVNQSYKDFIYTQLLDINLNSVATDTTGTNWTVGFNPGQLPVYGAGVHAELETVSAALQYLTVDSGFATQAEWLQALYFNALPLYDPMKESKPPAPTRFAVQQPDGTWTDFSISQWNQRLQLTPGWAPFSTATLKFYTPIAGADTIYSVAGMVVRPKT